MTHEVGPEITRRRRPVIASAAAVALMAVVIGGTTLALAQPWSDGDESAVPIASPSEEPMTTSPPGEQSASSLGALTYCSAIPPLPRDTPVDTTLDAESVQLRLDYTDADAQAHTYVIAYEDDPTCAPREDIQRVVSSALQPPSAAPGDPAAPSADLQNVAERFLGFARGERDGVPADAPVDLYVGGVLVKTIPSDRQSDRRAWEGCPHGADFDAGRDCPISAIDALAEWPGEIAITTHPPRHPCAHPTRPPSSLSAYGSVTLTPDADLDCTNYVSVQLFVNDVAQIVAVNVVVSEP
jgi:hypothetical protein